MHLAPSISFLLLSLLLPSSNARNIPRCAAALPPTMSFEVIGNATSNFPNVYRDGGGGGKVGGLNIVQFSDTLTTNVSIGPRPHHMVGFTSNSLVVSGDNGQHPQHLKDFGKNEVPSLGIPWYPPEVLNTAIWPDTAIATGCNGDCGFAWYMVFNRTTNNSLLYTTAVKMTINETTGGPSVERPVKDLFGIDELPWGTFSALSELGDGYVYLFARVQHVPVTGLKMARVQENSVFEHSAYQYWNGDEWSTTAPAADNSYANVFNWTMSAGGPPTPPASGDIFWNTYYNCYMIIFQGMGWDPHIWMSYSSQLHTGWSEPVVVAKTPEVVNFNYCFHVYPKFYPTQEVLPMSFTQQDFWTDESGERHTYTGIAWANITFS